MKALAVAPLAFLLVFGVSEAARLWGVPVGFCLVQRLFGIRCPGCGLTRGIAAPLRGDFTTAIAANVAVPVVCAYALVCAGLTLTLIVRPDQYQVLLKVALHNERVMVLTLLIAWVWHS